MRSIFSQAIVVENDRRRFRACLLSGAAAVSALALAAPAHAQTAQLEEVIVNARKRQESILNVPVVTTAVAGETIERMQVTNVRAVASLVPGLLLGEQVGVTGVQISLRGVGTTTIDPGIDQSVSLNIDGLQLSQGLAFQSAMFDVGQLEVYKGPQALFYGKSSPGGVIAIRTADPTNKGEVIVRAGYEFEAREWQQDFIVSGPIHETLKARIAVRHSDAEGYFKNRAVVIPNAGGLNPDDKRLNATKRWLIRGTLLWTPTDNFDMRLKANYAHDRIKYAGTGQLVSCPEGIRVLNPATPWLTQLDSCKLDRTAYSLGMDPANWPGIPNGGIPGLDQFQRYGTAEFNYRPTQGLKITSTTGYYSVRAQTLLSSTGSTLYPAATASQNNMHRRDFTEELRVNSDFQGPLNFTAGGFYQDADVDMQITQRSNLLGPVAALGVIRNSSGFHTLRIKSKSAFGQLRYQVIPEVELSGGVRYTDEKRTDVARALPQYGGAIVPIATPELHSKNWSPEFTISYKPTSDVTIFGSWKKGYKSGSFNITTLPLVPNSEISYGDEMVKGVEGGVKARLLDRTLQVNLAGYNYRYNNLQVGAALPPAPGQINVTSRTVNAAKAKVYGVDFDFAYLTRVEGLTVKGAVNWNKARYVTFLTAPCWSGQTIALGCTGTRSPATGLFNTQDLGGLPLIRAPEWQSNVGFTYQHPIGNRLKLVVENNNQFSSKYVTYLGRRPDMVQNGYAKVDLSVALQGPDDRWEIAVTGRNLNNKLTAGNCNVANYEGGVLGLPPSNTSQGGVTNGPAGVGEVSCYVERGREVWVTFTFRPFGG